MHACNFAKILNFVHFLSFFGLRTFFILIRIDTVKIGIFRENKTGNWGEGAENQTIQICIPVSLLNIVWGDGAENQTILNTSPHAL